jgi:hypothetical protein
MLYLILFTLISGVIASFLFFLIFKRHIRKNGNVKEKSFIVNAPKIFGTINIILAVVFGIWYVSNPSAFSQNEPVNNKIVFILLSIFFTYFYVLALPLSIGSSVLTLFLKKSISKIRFLYYILTNIIASIILFILNYMILNK